MALLQVESLTVRRGTRTVVENFNMKIDSGNCIILTGDNGSGKSTLIEAIAGILPIQSGNVTLSRPFGLTLQSGGFNGDELVNERLKHAAQASGISGETISLLKHWNLDHRSHDRIGHLSGGMSRRLAVMQGLMPGYGDEPRICLLDEPSEGLDEDSVTTLLNDISAMRTRGHAFLIATHDARLKGCATTLLEMDGSSTNVEPTIGPGASPQLSTTDVRTSVSHWSSTLDRRTMWPLLSRGLPLLASMLVIFALLGNEIGALVLVPTFLAALPALSSLHHAKEARAGEWWIAMGGRLFTIDPLSTLLILVSPLLTASVFGVEHDGVVWMVVGVPFVGIYLASGAIHELAMKMPRAEAQFVPLLSLILIWPLLIANDAIYNCTANGICSEPWPSILIATCIPLIIWFALPILHPRTGSN
ncbi:MAG: ATP-binding cassette domain-containing protein [Candidatus Thermoplasmatota archaeon]|nr:ATP-binding cassette domain-containing protein [Candidatus Thermoplasmatota archaeon]